MTALLFDYRNFGASDGARRQHIDPNAQLEDYRNAISFAESLQDVDPDRIGAWALSYSGGHVLILGATDPRVKCVSSQIPVVDGYRNMRRVHGTIGFRKFEQLLLADRRRPLRDRRGRLPPTRSPGSNDRGFYLALPGDLRDLPRAKGSPRRRCTRTGARSNRQSC